MAVIRENQSEFLENNRRQIEDTFFRQQDKVLIEQLRLMKQQKETKEALEKASGIHGEEILDKLVNLGVRPETLAAVALVPVVEVAWASGSVTSEEEAAVLSAAQKSGMSKDGIEYKLLKEWLKNKPPAGMLDAWSHYTAALCRRLTPEECATFQKEVIGHAREVAEASGGILGFGTISKAEREVLVTMEKAFSQEG